jgi:hypothetical protein
MTEFFNKMSKHDIRNTIVILDTVLSFAFLFMLMFKAIPEANQNAVNVLGGIIIGQLVTVYGFYFTQSKMEVDEKKKNITP